MCCFFVIENLKDETETDKLRSILAQMDYKYSVCRYDDQGVPFRMYLHVPEIHPDSGNVFMEREDEGHVLKVTNLLCMSE